MKFARTWIRVSAAIALLAMAAPSGAVSADRGASATACGLAHHADSAVPVGADSAVPVGQEALDEFELAGHNIPICSADCSHSAGLGCCGSVVVATPSVIVVAISAAGDLPYEADQSLSGIEPDALQEPPQHSA